MKKREIRKFLFASLFSLFSISSCYCQTSEVHFGVTTIGTTINNLLRLYGLSLKEFRTELEQLGYDYYRIEITGISMTKGELKDNWVTRTSLIGNGLVIVYKKLNP